MQPKYFFWAIFLITFYLILKLYEPFLMNLIVALLLCVATFGLKKYVDRFIKYNFLSSFVSVFIFLAFFIIPLLLVSNEIINQILQIDLSKISVFIKEIQNKTILLLEGIPNIAKNRAIESIKSININTIISYTMSISTYIGKTGISFITDLVFVLIFLYLFYYYGLEIKSYIVDVIPFDKKSSNNILAETSGVLRVVFFTTIISMILQGISFGIAISFLGFSGILFGTLYALASIVPVVGGALIWVPCGLYIYWSGDFKSAIFLSLYSLIFIGFIIDNVIKPLIISFVNKTLLKKPVKVNEIIIFIAILAGLASFGFWGIIIGPTMSAFFIALIRVYKYQFKER
ncbi:AI-2E family transporter [Helicobacter sp. MIT 14-3879]|uniref:AI-2E family transporter n=1 Tax=Helicobacter sp. MIT 14-3879 TaxID=2040649 RepID=UPI000E1ED326|nr:AI-2E family transporter [Helicobacter sp. MIT 14-3879]RDU65639.1 AI-2E family transporter [Helicobacter sp. MIT 14-3879]